MGLDQARLSAASLTVMRHHEPMKASSVKVSSVIASPKRADIVRSPLRTVLVRSLMKITFAGEREHPVACHRQTARAPHYRPDSGQRRTASPPMATRPEGK